MTVKSQLALPSGEAGARKQFIRVNIAKAGAGIMLATAFIVLVGKPDGAEMLAISGLCIPLLLACLGWTPIPLAILETLSFATFSALIGYLAALTGGLSSPLLIWFALVPAEAALAGGRSTVVRAAALTIIALLAVGIMQVMGVLPRTELENFSWQVS